MRRPRWRTALALTAAAGVVVPAGLAWACVGLVSLTTATKVVQPGGTVTLVGREFAQGAPVRIHLDSPSGPLLATVPPPTTTMTSQFSVDVAIPADVELGEHVLLALQDYHNMNVGSPARATIYVGSPPALGPSTEEEAARPAELIVSPGPTVGSLLAIGLGVAAGVLFLVGALGLVASRRQSPVAETVRGSSDA